MTKTAAFLPLLTVALAVSCATTEKPAANNAAKSEAAAPATPSKDVPPAVASLVANFQRIYFDFDSSDINAETKEALTANAAILKANPDIRIEIQGHADDRGTSEYNLALGDRRAKAVRDYLVSLGTTAENVKTLSYGEERPIEPSVNEAAWSKNRRSEFRVLWGKDKAVGTVE